MPETHAQTRSNGHNGISSTKVSVRPLSCIGTRLRPAAKFLRNIGLDPLPPDVALPANIPRQPCDRNVLWFVKGLGGMCDYHFQEKFNACLIDPDDVVRLSEDEQDFVVRGAPGMGTDGPRVRDARMHNTRMHNERNGNGK